MWTYVGISLGLDGSANKSGMACVYSKGTNEYHQCHYNLASFDERDIDPSLPYTIELFEGCRGTVSEIKIEPYFKTPEEYSKAALKGGKFISDNLNTLNSETYAPGAMCQSCGDSVL